MDIEKIEEMARAALLEGIIEAECMWSVEQRFSVNLMPQRRGATTATRWLRSGIS